MTTVVNEMNKVTDVISKWTSEEDSKRDDDVSVGQIQGTELSEANDNSVSVYLDANSGDYHEDSWNDNDLTQALSLTTNCNSNDDDLSSGRRGRRHGSTTPDSDATEIPADGDGDEEETLFLSLSSDVGVQSHDSLMIPGGFAVGTLTVGVANDERPEVTSPVDSQPHRAASEDIIETIHILLSSPSSNQAQESKKATCFPPGEVERYAAGSKPTQPHTSQPPRAARNKRTAASTAAKAVAPTSTRPSTVAAKRVSSMDLKNVRAKVGSANVKAKVGSPSKTSSQVL